MELGANIDSWTSGRGIFLCQILIALLGLIVIGYAPRSADETALIVPLSAAARANLVEVLSQRDVLVLSRGRWEGSYIINGPHPHFAKALFEGGLLILRASAPGCGPVNAESAT